MTDRPRVSVIVPCYNGEAFVGQCIESVIEQTMGAWELIVVDDGSSDGSADVVGSYQDSRVRLVSQNNRGVATARNEGVSHSSAPYLAFLDADDLFEPDNLAAKADVLDRAPEVVLVHSDRTDFWPDGRTELHAQSKIAGDALSSLVTLTESVNAPTSAVIRRTHFDTVGGFDTRLGTSADLDLWIRLALQGRFEYLRKPLVRYRRHAGQMHLNIADMERDMVTIGRKITNEQRIPKDLARVFALKRARVLAGSYYHHTKRLDRAGRWGLEYLWRSFKSAAATPPTS